MRPLSYSQIALYLACPLCYRLQYVDGLRTKPKHYFSFGSTLHQCVRHFFKQAWPLALEELLSYYEVSWLSLGYRSAEEEARYKEDGRAVLTRFWRTHRTSFRTPLAMESMFQVDIDGVQLRGFIDRVDRLEGGGLEVTDYKTGRELFHADELQNNLQLTLYQVAAEATWHLPVAKLVLYHLRSNIPFATRARSQGQLAEARRLVTSVASSIAQENFPATPGEHCPCDFAGHCPDYAATMEVGDAELS